jgi:predicted metal-dependent hydrolase
LILAPADVLEYVVAHEMAHLRHMNHGREFWDLCKQLAPHTPSARKWLKANGPGLHRYG